MRVALSPSRRPGRLLVAAVTVTVASLMAAPPVPAASPAEESRFVTLINDLRAGNGLGTLTVNGSLSATACAWTEQMVAAGAISHDPNLAAAAAASDPNWRKVGENVGKGSDVNVLMDAFVASPGHLANLLDPEFNQMGVCVIRDGDVLYTTHRFLRSEGPPPTTAAPPTAPPATQAPAPPPTAPAPTAPATGSPTTSAPQPPTTSGQQGPDAGEGEDTPVEPPVPTTGSVPVAGVPAGETAAGSSAAAGGTGTRPSVVPAMLDQLRRLDPQA